MHVQLLPAPEESTIRRGRHFDRFPYNSAISIGHLCPSVTQVASSNDPPVDLSHHLLDSLPSQSYYCHFRWNGRPMGRCRVGSCDLAEIMCGFLYLCLSSGDSYYWHRYSLVAQVVSNDGNTAIRQSIRITTWKARCSCRRQSLFECHGNNSIRDFVGIIGLFKYGSTDGILAGELFSQR